MKTLFNVLLFSLFVGVIQAQTDSIKTKIPFEGMNLSWVNGQNRQQTFPLTMVDKKTNDILLTGVAYLDTYFNYDFNRPIDHTHTISSTIGRSNEFTLNLASIGIETTYKNVIGRIWLQFGQMGSIIQEQDVTTLKGRNTSISNLKNIREAAAGYHFNKAYGLNLEMGIFMSYIGLESYLTQENWNYQRSMVCDFTPFYFSGARIQYYPSKKYRTELWLLNGWQSYNSWNKGIGVGNSNYYRPNENLQLVANFYLGTDSKTDIHRFHHDNSVVLRYLTKPHSQGLSQAAFSLNTHYGFQYGTAIGAATKQYMLGSSLSNRFWFNKNKLAISLRADALKNPGLYLAYSPSPISPNDFTDAVAADPKQNLSLFQASSTLDIMPNDFFTFRIEHRFRASNKPYFPGHGGTTSPDGWIDTPALNWKPELTKTEQSITVAFNFRF